MARFLWQIVYYNLIHILPKETSTYAQHHLRRELLKFASTILVYVKRKLINKLKTNAISHLSKHTTRRDRGRLQGPIGHFPPLGAKVQRWMMRIFH